MIHHSLLKTKITKHPFYNNEDDKKINYITKLLSLYILKLKYKSLDVLFNVLYDSTKEEIDHFIMEFLPYDYIRLSNHSNSIKYIDIIFSRIVNRLLYMIYYDTKMKRINDTSDEFIKILNRYINDKCNSLKVDKKIKDRVTDKVITYINGVYNNDTKIMNDIYINIDIDFIGGIMEFIDNLKKINEDKSSPTLYFDFANQRFNLFISKCIENITKLNTEYDIDILSNGDNINNTEMNHDEIIDINDDKIYDKTNKINHTHKSNNNINNILSPNIIKKVSISNQESIGSINK